MSILLLVLVFIILVVHRHESPLQFVNAYGGRKYAAETHVAFAAGYHVAVANKAHDKHLIISNNSGPDKSCLPPERLAQLDRNYARFVCDQWLVWDQQKLDVIALERRGHWQSLIGDQKTIAAFQNLGVAASNIRNYQRTYNFLPLAELPAAFIEWDNTNASDSDEWFV
jgi:hypothetical protein